MDGRRARGKGNSSLQTVAGQGVRFALDVPLFGRRTYAVLDPLTHALRGRVVRWQSGYGTWRFQLPDADEINTRDYPSRAAATVALLTRDNASPTVLP